MTLTGDKENWLYGLMIGLFYVLLFTLSVVRIQLVFERTVLLIFLATGISIILSMVLSGVGINTKRFRFMPVEVYGLRFSLTIFILSVFVLKPLVG